MINIAVPWGIFGMGNIGDEITLQGFARLAKPYRKKIRIWTASRNISHAVRVEPSLKYYQFIGNTLAKRLALYMSSVHLIVGDTPVMDVLGDWPLKEIILSLKPACRRKKPIIFVASGSEYLKNEESKSLVRKVLAPSVKSWSVRSQYDKERLTSYGVDPEGISVTADLGWLLPLDSKDLNKSYIKKLGVRGEGPLIGVNITNEHWISQKQPLIFSCLAKTFDLLIEKYKANIIFFSMVARQEDVFDYAASHKTRNLMKYRDKAFIVPNKYWTPKEMASLIACCHVNIGMRYHFCLLSSLQSIPFISIDRLGKLEDLCRDMDWPYHLSLENLSEAKLIDFYSDIRGKIELLAERLGSQAELMRQRAAANDVIFKKILNYKAASN